MIEVLKQALDALYPISHNSTDDYRGRADKAISFLLKAIAELESQEPVADDFFRMIADRNPKPFSLPPRTWVGLTEDDKVLIKHDANFNQFMTAGEYADRVQQLTEARLKDKNT